MNWKNIPYICLRSFVRFVTNGLYYSRVKVVGRDNVPPPCTPIVIASNHFNGLNDALAILFSMTDRKPYFIVRADVFENRIANRFLRSIGLLPAYRLDFDGAEAMSSNLSTFSSSEKMLLDGGTVVMFPQAGHSAGYWIDEFTGGMAKMVFEAAAADNFEKEILIVPACNFYRDVEKFHSDMLVKFDEPVKASQFYDLYRTKPRTAMRTLNRLIMDRVAPMMLNITDREHYAETRFILGSGYMKHAADRFGIDNSDIEGNLNLCKRVSEGLHSALKQEDPFLPSVASHRGDTAEDLKRAASEARASAMRKSGVASAEKGPVAAVYEKAASLAQKESSLGLDDGQFDRRPTRFSVSMAVIALLLLLPLAVFCLWPSVFCWFVPHFFSSRMKGGMFEGTFLIAMNALLILPLAAVFTLIIGGLLSGFLPALLHVALFPAICLFEFYYFRLVRRTFGDFKWLAAFRRGDLQRTVELRRELFSELDSILK